MHIGIPHLLVLEFWKSGPVGRKHGQIRVFWRIQVKNDQNDPKMTEMTKMTQNDPNDRMTQNDQKSKFSAKILILPRIGP